MIGQPHYARSLGQGSYSNFVNKLTQGIFLPQGTFKLKMKMVTSTGTNDSIYYLRLI